MSQSTKCANETAETPKTLQKRLFHDGALQPWMRRHNEMYNCTSRWASKKEPEALPEDSDEEDGSIHEDDEDDDEDDEEFVDQEHWCRHLGTSRQR